MTQKIVALAVYLPLLTASHAISLDLNNTGISDVWEFIHNATTLDPDADGDGDGMTNREEAVAGTDPFDRNSVLSLVSKNDEDSAWEFSSQRGKIYQVEVSSDLAAWMPLGSVISGDGNLITISTPPPPANSQGIVRSRWSNSPGVSLDQFTSYARTGSPLPTFTDGAASVDFPQSNPNADTYGQWIRGWLRPPTTSQYRFWLASDDDSSFWLSSDEDPANSAKIAQLSGYSGYKQWNASSGLQSLIADKLYYFEVFHREGGGGDHVSAAWSGGSLGSTPVVISGDALVRDPAALSRNFYRVRAMDRDSDSDTLSDWEESLLGTDPLKPQTNPGVNDAEYAAASFKRGNSAPVVFLNIGGPYTKVPATVTLTATPLDYDGSIERVEFFEGTTNIGSDSTPPYQITIPSVAAGDHSFTAKAYDNQGAVGTDTRTAIVKALLLPAAHLVYNVQAEPYNAKGDGVTDDTDAIQTAINAAIAAGNGRTVYLPAGNYKLSKPGVGRYLTIDNADNLVFTGETGTRLLAASHAQILGSDGAKGLKIQNLEIDRDPLNMTQGTIIAIDRTTNKIQVKLDPGYDRMDREGLIDFTELYLWTDPKFGWNEPYGGRPQITAREEVSPGVWELTMTKIPPEGPVPFPGDPRDVCTVGAKAALWGDKGSHGFSIWGCKDLEITDVSYFGGSTAMYIGYCTGTTRLTRVNIGPPPGSGRLITGEGGVMYKSNRGELIVESCDWSQVNDDAIDTLTDSVTILRQPDAKTLVGNYHDAPYQPGDTIEIWEWTLSDDGHATGRLRPVETNVIVSVSRDDTAKEVTITLRDPVQSVATDTNPLRFFDINLAGNVTIRNSRSHSHRARPYLLKSGGQILIENCVIYNATSTGVLGSIDFGEGPGVRGITIRNSEFFGCGTAPIFLGIYDNPIRKTGYNVLIENNYFHDNGIFQTFHGGRTINGPAIELGGIDGVIIRNNRFENIWNASILMKQCTDVEISNNSFIRCNQINPPHYGLPNDTDSVVYLDDCDDVRLSGNTVTLPGIFYKRPITQTPTTTNVSGF